MASARKKTGRKKRSTPRWIARLTRRCDLCPEAVRWLHTRRSLRHAWNTCDRVGWMGWLTLILHVRDRLIARDAACAVDERAAWYTDVPKLPAAARAYRKHISAADIARALNKRVAATNKE